MPKEVFVLSMVMLVGGFFLLQMGLRAFIRSKERPAPLRDDRLDQLSRQIETLQQSIDATAIEVERLGEGLRFTTKVLAERNAPVAELRQPGRVNTPH
jgi:hypothetical protein